MPVIKSSSYPGAPWYQYNGHLQTIIPSVVRKVPEVIYERERLELEDGDFLDLDWMVNRNDQLLVLTHGLEGSSDRQYIKGMARVFYERGWDILAWNCRSCSGEMNRSFRLYYHGEIEDIHRVVLHALQWRPYRRVVLIGFSMGGNITLKYLGVHGDQLPPEIEKGIAFSCPCDLPGSVKELEKPRNRFYKKKFYNRLKEKITAKSQQYPDRIDVSLFDKIEEWRDFDEFFSAPLNNLSSAEEFYYEASSRNFVDGIRIPTLLVNAQNDPLLSDSCSPKELADNHPFFFVETPSSGGHVGFVVPGKRDSWSEVRALEFCEE